MTTSSKVPKLNDTWRGLTELMPWLEAECAAAGLPCFAFAAEGPDGAYMYHDWGCLAGPAHFRFGSWSKVLSMTGLLLAEARGHLSLRMPLATFLPEVASIDMLRTACLVDLVGHQTALARVEGACLCGPTGRYLDPPSMSTKQILWRLRRHRAPGGPRRWRYSDFGISLAILALCRATGQSYAAFLDRTLLRPEGLDRLFVEPMRGGDKAQVRQGHVRPEEPLPSTRTSFCALDPAFGAHGSIAQLTRLFHRVITGRLLPALTSARLSRFPHSVGKRSDGYRTGTGLFRFPVGDSESGDYCVGHQMVFAGNCGFMAHHPASRLTVTFITNTLASLPDEEGNRREPNPTGLVRHIFQNLDVAGPGIRPPLWRAPSVT